MIRALPRTSLGARIAATCAACAVAAVALWPVAPAPSRHAGTGPRGTTAGSAVEGDDRALRRPIFDAERRSWTAFGTLADVRGEERARPVLALRGVLVDAGRRRAFLADGAAEPRWFGEGEGEGAWTVLRIEPGRVTVEDGGVAHELRILGDPVRLRPPLRLGRSAGPSEGAPGPRGDLLGPRG